MVKIWLTTVESGLTDTSDGCQDDIYPDADGVAVNGPIISVVRRDKIKVLSERLDGGSTGQDQIRTLAMYPIGVVRKVAIDE